MFVQYSGDPNTRHFLYLNVGKLFGPQMCRISNAIRNLDLKCPDLEYLTRSLTKLLKSRPVQSSETEKYVIKMLGIQIPSLFGSTLYITPTKRNAVILYLLIMFVLAFQLSYKIILFC